MQSFLQTLGISHPIFQAPMAGVSTPELAAAVSNAGGLGAIGLGPYSPQKAAEKIQQTRELTEHPFNVNVFCHQPAVADPQREAAWLNHLAPYFSELDATPPQALHEPYPSFIGNSELLEVLLQEKPAVVSFHFGLPEQAAISALKDSGIILLATATTPEEAKLAEDAGMDALIAQGIEAGGHRGVFDPEEDREIGTLALVRLLCSQNNLPIIAAGGIMDGAGIHAALSLGASAVQMGTAFILCPESAADDNFRAALKSERAHNTAITANISGRPARGIANRFFRDLNRDAPARPDYPICYSAGKALANASAAAGSDSFAVQWAGQGAPLCRALPAAELITTLVAELEATQ
ncbi:nitronate monooxygenase family protein [Microbulbifer sp. THAF38]|uniref:NAD(P)H-dependent flavin oxidoreductase n=1 Tax=Microbulbifer sp. THAF38 TaxID=2587856 RepID=UPI0012A78B3D|nr:nitronate monooxygenase [Microbulbifer sp. THAF38]QFT55784.1 Nitronate monooxygenase [Microbulbifer sp. THAF38]